MCYNVEKLRSEVHKMDCIKFRYKKMKTAGAWFVGVFMREILHEYPKFCDDVNKRSDFIKYFHKEYGENLGYTFDTTKAKCYAVIEIIRAGRVLDAIEYVIETNEKKVPEEAYEAAAELLDDIVKEKVVLPEAVEEDEE